MCMCICCMTPWIWEQTGISKCMGKPGLEHSPLLTGWERSALRKGWGNKIGCVCFLPQTSLLFCFATSMCCFCDFFRWGWGGWQGENRECRRYWAGGCETKQREERKGLHTWVLRKVSRSERRKGTCQMLPSTCQAWNASAVMTVTSLGTHQLKFNKRVTPGTADFFFFFTEKLM